MGTRGGKYEGTGRPKGATNKKTQELIEKVASEGITPLQFMLRVMRDESVELPRRDEMAKAAAPYIHAKLSSVEQNLNVQDHEARIAKFRELGV